MRYVSYNNELQITAAQIMNVFNNIVIKRDNKKILVPCVYGPKSRMLKDIDNPSKVTNPPLICFSPTMISRDTTRVASVNRNLEFQVGDKYDPIFMQPIPLNIEYQVSILVKYESDLDQIMCNFVPFFNPSIYIVFPNPKKPTVNIKAKLLWSGDFAVDYQEDISKEQNVRATGDSTFTLQTWIFPGTEEYPKLPTIKTVNFIGNLYSQSPEPTGTSGNVGTSEETGGYMLDRFFTVPTNISFDDYTEGVIQGMINPTYTDMWRVRTGVSGLWADISAVFSDSPGASATISGNPFYACRCDEYGSSGLIIMNTQKYLPIAIENLDREDFWQFYMDTISGDLKTQNNRTYLYPDLLLENEPPPQPTGSVEY